MGVSAGSLPPWITVILAIFAGTMTTDVLRTRSLENPLEVVFILASLLTYSSAAVISRRPWLGLIIFLLSSSTAAAITDTGGVLIISCAVVIAVLFICGSALLMMVSTILITLWAFAASLMIHEDLSMVRAIAIIGVPVACIGFVIGRFRHAVQIVETRNKELEEQKLHIRARERESLARDLHDIVANQLTSMTLVAGSRAHSTQLAELQEALTEIKGLSREALIELRKLLDVLRTNESPINPTGNIRLESQNIEECIQHVATRLEEFDFTVELSANALDQPPLSTSTVDAILRILQECSTNAMKYARPSSTIHIQLDRDQEQVHLSFNSHLSTHASWRSGRSELSSGQGLIGIRERVQLLGGESNIGPNNGQWVVEASFPA